MFCMAAAAYMTIETLASLQCQDGARQIFTDRADIACVCTKREAERSEAKREVFGESHGG